MLNFFSNSVKTPRLVVGLNKVDVLIPDGWDSRLNAPTTTAQKQIERRCSDIIARLAKYTKLPIQNIEYYSAEKHFKLLPLLSKIIRNAYAGFKLDNISPADPFELADPDVKDFATQQRQKKGRPAISAETSRQKIFDEMKKLLPSNEFSLVLQKFSQEKAIPPKVAVIGKSGVGKTTTVNKLFNASFKTSHTGVGTIEEQKKTFALKSGGEIDIIDLPGYGRTMAEDEKYDTIYADIIPIADVVLLVIQANTRDFSDDEEMIIKITKWLEKSDVPTR